MIFAKVILWTNQKTKYIRLDELLGKKYVNIEVPFAEFLHIATKDFKVPPPLSLIMFH